MNQLHRSYQRAYLLAEQGRYDLATCEIQELLAHNPNNSQAYILLSDCFSKQKRHQEAILAAKQAITLSPQNEACYYTLARAYSWDGKWLNAQEAINVALKINPNIAEFLAQASLILLRLWKYEDALEHSESGLRQDPHNGLCLSVKVEALMELERFEEAKALIPILLAQSPNTSFLYLAQGWMALYESQPAIAQASFREALRLNPTSNSAREEMMEALKTKSWIYRWIFRFDLRLARLYKHWRHRKKTHRLVFFPLMIIYWPIRFLTLALRISHDYILRFDLYGNILLLPEEASSSRLVIQILGWILAVCLGAIAVLFLGVDPWLIFKLAILSCVLMAAAYFGRKAWRAEIWNDRLGCALASAVSLITAMFVMIEI